MTVSIIINGVTMATRNSDGSIIYDGSLFGNHQGIQELTTMLK